MAGGQSGGQGSGRSGGQGGSAGPSRLRGAVLVVAAALSFTIAVPLFALGLALLIVGVLSWLHHPADLAPAWARTLAGMGLIGAGACLAALGWPRVGWLRIGTCREAAAAHRETAMSRRLKFIAVIGLLLALVCLPFGAAIRVAAHGPWLGWGR